MYMTSYILKHFYIYILVELGVLPYSSSHPTLTAKAVNLKFVAILMFLRPPVPRIINIGFFAFLETLLLQLYKYSVNYFLRLFNLYIIT